MELHEIIEAIKAGKTVHWSNSGYIVYLDNDKPVTMFKHNNSCCGLQPSEYEDCFIAKELY